LTRFCGTQEGRVPGLMKFGSVNSTPSAQTAAIIQILAFEK
jgi:hypothetical protein